MSTCGPSWIFWTQEPRSCLGHSGGNGPGGTTVVRSMSSIIATGWHLVQVIYGNRRPSALEAAVGSTFCEGTTASAPACGAYGRPHGSQNDTGPGDDDGQLEIWRVDVALFCRRCIQSNRYRRGPAALQGELQQATAGGPFTKIHVDFTGPHVRSMNGFIYLLTAVDYFTKCLICIPIRVKSALSVAKALIKHVDPLFGCPVLQISNVGGEFQNDIMRNIADLLGIQLSRTTAYRPSRNAAVERAHRTINAIFAKMVDKNQRN